MKIKLINYQSIFFLFLSSIWMSTYAEEDDFFDEEVLENSISQLEISGELLLRVDAVRDLPRPVKSDFDRVTGRGLLGITWLPAESIELGLAGKVNLSTQSNSLSRFNLDNERADAISLDELYLSIQPDVNTELLIGQSHFPLRLTSMVWDEDLRPQGISISHVFEFGGFNSFEMIVGHFLGNHLYGDDSRINAFQGALKIGEGKKLNFDVIFSYLDFYSLDKLSLNGLARTNQRSASGTLVNDFDIADLQLGVNYRWKGVPIRAKLDLLNNLAVSNQDSGIRAEIRLGNSFRQEGFEIGFASQRIQQEAVVAAFNDDDWWFATRMRGTTGWLSYGFNDSVRAKLALFSERRDDIADNNKRALFDVQYFF